MSDKPLPEDFDPYAATGALPVTREPFGGLTEAEIDAIAEKAAKKALQSVYADIGRSALKKLAWLTGIVVFSLLVFLAGKGAILK